MRIHGLQKVLSRKRDPLTQVLFSDAFNADAANAVATGNTANAINTAAVAAAKPSESVRWACGDNSLLRTHPMLSAIASAAARQQEAPTAPPASTPPAASDATSDVLADDMGVLWALLPAALQAGIEQACAAAPFVRQSLTSELPRMMALLSIVEGRVVQQLDPTAPPVQLHAALGSSSMFGCLATVHEAHRRAVRTSLFAACEEQLAALVKSAEAGAEGAVDYARKGEGRRLGSAIEAELARGSMHTMREAMGHGGGGHVAIEVMVAGAAARAIGLFATKVEAGLCLDEGDTAARMNAGLLTATGELYADVLALLAADLSEEPKRALREALVTLGPVCTALANPAIPMPEAMREEAARLLKSFLRREMIDGRDREA